MAQLVHVEASGVAQRVVGRADQHIGVAGHRLGMGVYFGRDAAHDREIDACPAASGAGFRGADRELHLDARVLLRELGEQARHEVLGGADQADRQLADLGAEQGLQVGLGILDLAEDAQAWCTSMSPASVSATPRPMRSNSGRPTLSSSCLSCIDTAGGVRCSSSAARA